MLTDAVVIWVVGESPLSLATVRGEADGRGTAREGEGADARIAKGVESDAFAGVGLRDLWSAVAELTDGLVSLGINDADEARGAGKGGKSHPKGSS